MQNINYKISPESILGNMSLAIACLDVAQVVAMYEQMPPNLLTRLKRECLTDAQGEWLDALIDKWDNCKNS